MTPADQRAAILAHIATALGRDFESGVRLPALDPWHGDDASAPNAGDRVALARRFKQELEAVGGEVHFVASAADADAAIATLAQQRGLGASDDCCGNGYSILRADALVASTGSAVVIERDAERRLAPYLARTCFIVADASVLHARLSRDALAGVFAAARNGDRGEGVIITGPSRTADIEKVLVLGAHGPKSVVVIITGIAPEERAAT